MPPKKKTKKEKEPVRVTITLPSDKQHWDRNLPNEHGM